ncbi:hypothetical protein DL769_001362 [Monosporascus sp. CRB-8-3]|nr:hypothetical protein DL769_001362 [Monosporascus sp. CRB-8-3]
MPRRIQHKEYTVGWVCALPIELAAAQEMLDEEHEDLERVENDENLYSLGSIGGHNVVIICLPAGRIGNNPAAAVATQMRATFKGIRFGLLVGIGGGVPSIEVDIRLGDVVVSQPHQTFGGVIQYDLGKATPDGFKQTGSLNSPPLILLNAVSKVRANDFRGKSKFPEHVLKLSRLHKFKRDNLGPDILFEAMYNHAGGPTCQLCCSDKEVDRQPRENEEAVVHYGTIASGNQVMRDGSTRDKVSKEFGGVLCFEMEAAGLMNSFPCLVIRGICDYADSHKNKKWQAYAAGTAAAYAKEILSVIPPAEVAKSRTADEIIKEKNALDSILDRLPYAENAPYNSYARQHEPTCLPDTRLDVRREIHEWADGQEMPCIFWLNGLAGTGKSTIARTVAQQFSEKEVLGASFFFSRGGGDASHAGKFVTTVAVQLANNVLSLKHYICEAIADRSDIASQSLRDQWHHLVLRPLSELDANGYQPSYVLVIDALDECEHDNNIRIILQLLAEARSLQKVRLRVFLTSRPEILIRYGFRQIPDAEHQDFVLHSISPSIIDHDIRIFLEHNLRLIGQERSLDSGWPGEDIIRCLVQHANGLFIWAATACRFIRDGKRFATKRLATILESNSTTITAPEKHLNKIYITVLEQSISPDFMDEEKEELYAMLRHVLGSVVVLLSPLSACSLSRLLHATKEEIDQTLEDLHAILDIPDDQTLPLRLHHPSFRDFLINKDRCGDLNFWVDEKQAHRTLAESCTRLMSNTLKQDVCGLDAPGTLLTDVESGRLEQYLPPEVQYACLYWVQHLQKGGAKLYDDGEVHRFLQAHMLHWLEALSWMRRISEGILAITFLESTVLTLEGHSLPVAAVTFSPDSKLVASSSNDGTVRLWDSAMGAPVHTLEGPSGYAGAVIFSPDGKLVASAWGDGTVWIWDSATGAVFHTLRGHSCSIMAMVFQPDGKLVASSLVDKTVLVWELAAGVTLHTLEGHLPDVGIMAMAFSPDGKLIARAWYDGTVRLWDSATGAALHTFKGRSDCTGVVPVAFAGFGEQIVQTQYDGALRLRASGTGAPWETLEGLLVYGGTVAFSSDAKLVASGSYTGTVRVWDSATGTALHTLEGHSRDVWAIAFSSDSKLIASASPDQTVRVWNSATGAALFTLEGRYGYAKAVMFSPDIASSSDDKTVRLWDPTIGDTSQTLERHSLPVTAVAFSPDSKLVASSSDDATIRLWDSTLGVTLYTLKGYSTMRALAFSPDGKMIASKCYEGTVEVWDSATGILLYTLKGDSGYARVVAFSPDGELVAWAWYDNTVKVSNSAMGVALYTFEGHPCPIRTITFSPDGKLVASTSDDRTVKLWDLATGIALQTLKGHSGPVRTVEFSPDCKMVASAADDGTVRLWDLATGAVLHTFEGHSGNAKAVAFSPDSKLVASTSDDRTVKLWDSATGAALQTREVDAVIWVLCFAPNVLMLETDRGNFGIQSVYTGSSPPWPGPLEQLPKAQG